MRSLSAGASRTGSVTSTVSVLSRASSAASPRASVRCEIDSVTRSLRPLITGPCVLRSSADIVPSVLSNAETEPFFPSAAIRTASSVASSCAEATLARMSFSSFAMSDMACHPVMRGPNPRIAPWLSSDADLRRQRGFGLFHDRLECSRFADCKIGQNLPVDRHASFGQPGDKAAVVQPKGPNRSVQTLDPQGTKRVLAAPVVPLGGLQNFLVLGVRGDATFNAGHGNSPCRYVQITDEEQPHSRGGREPVSRSAASIS